jgi:hypothetical protein
VVAAHLLEGMAISIGLVVNVFAGGGGNGALDFM